MFSLLLSLPISSHELQITNLIDLGRFIADEVDIRLAEEVISTGGFHEGPSSVDIIINTRELEPYVLNVSSGASCGVVVRSILYSLDGKKYNILNDRTVINSKTVYLGLELGVSKCKKTEKFVSLSIEHSH